MVDWPEIVQRHREMVWQTVYRLLGRECDAADAFQETFVAAMEVAGRQEVRNWEAMLRRLATTRSIDVLRRRIRQRDRESGELSPEHLDRETMDPGTLVENQEQVERLRTALAKLPPRHAELYCLRYVSQMTYQEIADEMNISPSNVGVLLNRTKERLGEWMQGRACTVRSWVAACSRDAPGLSRAITP